MSQYWWVNHKQTWRQEIEGQYLWSPKTNANHSRNEFYNNMRRASPGDRVLSYADQQISYVGRAVVLSPRASPRLASRSISAGRGPG
jgi:putative restriction endonuclease